MLVQTLAGGIEKRNIFSWITERRLGQPNFWFSKKIPSFLKFLINQGSLDCQENIWLARFLEHMRLKHHFSHNSSTTTLSGGHFVNFHLV